MDKEQREVGGGGVGLNKQKREHFRLGKLYKLLPLRIPPLLNKLILDTGEVVKSYTKS